MLPGSSKSLIIAGGAITPPICPIANVNWPDSTSWVNSRCSTRSEAQTPQHLRQGHRGTIRYLESSHTPFPQYGDALASDRSKGHVRDRRGRGTLVGPPANSVPGCGPRCALS